MDFTSLTSNNSTFETSDWSLKIDQSGNDFEVSHVGSREFAKSCLARVD